MGNKCQNSCRPSLDSNQVPPQFKSKMLPLYKPVWSLGCNCTLCLLFAHLHPTTNLAAKITVRISDRNA